MQIVEYRDLAVPVDRVWAAVTEVDNAPEIYGGVDAVERLDGGISFDVGTRWLQTRSKFGRTLTSEIVVIAVDPGRGYLTETVIDGATYRTRVVIEERSDRTRLTVSFEVGATSRFTDRLLLAAAGRLFAGATRRDMRRDLDQLARHLASAAS